MVKGEETIFDKLKEVAREHNLLCRAILDIEGGRGWINYSKIEENDYVVQVSTSVRFDEYKKIRDAIDNIFESVNAVRVQEDDWRKRAIGFQKELKYMDKTKHDEQLKGQDKATTNTSIGTLINGTVDTGGGSFNTGSANTIDNSTTSSLPDNGWFRKEVVKMILSFIGGVGTTLLAQWIMRAVGWME